MRCEAVDCVSMAGPNWRARGKLMNKLMNNRGLHMDISRHRGPLNQIRRGATEEASVTTFVKRFAHACDFLSAALGASLFPLTGSACGARICEGGERDGGDLLWPCPDRPRNRQCPCARLPHRIASIAPRTHAQACF
jgi:hypothetical protein